MPNPWDVPPYAQSGESKPDPIYLAIGYSLSTWEFLEEALASLFAFLVGKGRTYPETSAAMRAYGSIVSFNSRAEMIGAAAKGFFQEHEIKDQEPEFREILKKCNGWAARRNDIAHGRVVSLAPSDEYYLIPALYNSRKHPADDDSPAFLYSAAQIRQFQQQFDVLHGDLATFLRHLHDAWRTSLGKPRSRLFLLDSHETYRAYRQQRPPPPASFQR